MAQELSTHVPAEIRTSFGKGFARRLRAAGQIPAVLYGHGTEPRHLALPGHQVALLLRRANAVLELGIEGAEQLALVKDVQKDPVSQIIEHIDLIVVRKGEKVQVEVPVHLIGDSFPGTLAALELNTITVEVAATSIPDTITVDVEGREEGQHITLADVVLPKGATHVAEDLEDVVVSVNIPVLETEEDETGEDAAPEGDVVPETED